MQLQKGANAQIDSNLVELSWPASIEAIAFCVALDMGRSHALPFITLSGDSKIAGEEEIILHQPEQLRYALLAAYSAVGNGAGFFESYRPKLIFYGQDGSKVIVPLLNPNRTFYWVAITHLDIDREIVIDIETYGKSGRAFVAAERAPRLHSDGTWDVSKGKSNSSENSLNQSRAPFGGPTRVRTHRQN